MTTKAINPELVSDTNDFSFKMFKSEIVDQIDVFHKGQRIAILNGISAPLQWTAKNGSVKLVIVEKLEKMVLRLIKKTNKQ
jgi:hypothetical protein